MVLSKARAAFEALLAGVFGQAGKKN